MNKSSIKRNMVSIAKMYLNARDIPGQQKQYEKFMVLCEVNKVDFANAWRGARKLAGESIACQMNGTHNN